MNCFFMSDSRLPRGSEDLEAKPEKTMGTSLLLKNRFLQHSIKRIVSETSIYSKYLIIFFLVFFGSKTSVCLSLHVRCVAVT